MPRKPKRRVWGTGSVMPSGERWIAQWRENGHKRSKTFSTRALAEEVLAKILSDIAMSEAQRFGLAPTPEQLLARMDEESMNRRNETILAIGAEHRRKVIAERGRCAEEAKTLRMKWAQRIERLGSVKKLSANGLLSAAEILAGKMELPEDLCGIYFLLRGDAVAYVGQSVSVLGRVSDHRRTGKVFDSFAFAPCPREQLNTLECLYIRLLNPPDNKNEGFVRVAKVPQQSEVAHGS